MLPLLTIEKAIAGGSFMTRHEGKVIFVPFVIPGETCTVRITGDHGQYSTGILETLVERSPGRIDPPCPAFTSCGGCAYLHMNYGTELSQKRDILIDALRRTGGIRPDDMPVIKVESGPRFRYRSHCTFKVRSGIPGFFREKSNDLVPLPAGGCSLLPEALNEYIMSVSWEDGEFRAAMGADDVILDSRTPGNVVAEKEKDITYHHHVTGFFQANRFLRSRMLEITEEMCHGSGGMSVVDIGCGCGFFSLYLAGRGYHVWACDVDQASIGMAKSNRESNSIENVVFNRLPGAEINPGRVTPDIVLADPPRTGLDKRTRKTICAMRPERIVYVSCNPVTFARDAIDFRREGYTLTLSVLLDMFPCTSHMEVISLLVRD